MHHYAQRVRFLCSASRIPTWDPTVSLVLDHPTLFLLEKCSTRHHFKQILAQVMRSRLIGQTFPMSRLLLFSAISHPHNLDLAKLLFTHFTPHPNLYIFNIMISAAATSVSYRDSFSLYASMLNSFTYPDKQTLLILLQASRCLSEVKLIQCHAIVTGLLSNHYLQNSLMKMYLEKGGTRLAHQVFRNMLDPDAVSFNIMILGLAKKGFSLEALGVFSEMVCLGLEPDAYTLVGVLLCCGHLGDSQLGKSLHAWTQRRGLIGSENMRLRNAILDMYMKCEKPGIARKLFNAMKEKDAVSWNTMIAGYVKTDNLASAHACFDEMHCRDHVSWNSLIAGYAQRGDFAMVRALFEGMALENIFPDEVTLLNLVSAAAKIRALDHGRCLHGWIVRMQMMDAFMASALIDLYCKCGSIHSACMIFEGVHKKDVTIWTAMIAGFAFHGHGSKALKLFHEMQGSVMPNHITLIAVLTACCHSGLVEQGLRIFSRMKDMYGIEPGAEHYGCLVDLLGRSGKLLEAKDVIDRMQLRPTRSIWGALLDASNACGNVEIAERAATELASMEPESCGGYIVLSNMYKANQSWKRSEQIREDMESRRLKKVPGHSSLETFRPFMSL